jgi:hypothetical protein
MINVFQFLWPLNVGPTWSRRIDLHTGGGTSAGVGNKATKGTGWLENTF